MNAVLKEVPEKRSAVIFRKARFFGGLCLGMAALCYYFDTVYGAGSLIAKAPHYFGNRFSMNGVAPSARTMIPHAPKANGVTVTRPGGNPLAF